MEIEIVELRLLAGNRALRAFCDVRVNDWIVHDFRVTQQAGQRISVLPPQVSWKDPGSGEIKFKGVLTIPPEQKQRIDTEILHAFQKEMEKQNGKTTR